MNIFLDDYRIATEVVGHTETPWVTCKDANAFKLQIEQLLEQKTEWIDEISFDFDLGYGGSGVYCMKYMLEQCAKWGLDVPVMRVHSGYPGARGKFQKQLELHVDLLPAYLLPTGKLELTY